MHRRPCSTDGGSRLVAGSDRPLKGGLSVGIIGLLVVIILVILLLRLL
jgi:hypothetical protein